MAKRTTKGTKKGTNLYDVLIKLIDAVYNLVNTGNIVGVILLFLCVQVFYISQKVSQNVIDTIVLKIFSIDYLYLIPLGLLLTLSIAANYIQHRVYKARISDLTKTRSQLIHGLKSGELEHLKKHTTSGIDSMESDNDC